MPSQSILECKVKYLIPQKKVKPDVSSIKSILFTELTIQQHLTLLEKTYSEKTLVWEEILVDIRFYYLQTKIARAKSLEKISYTF